MRLFQL